jgi:Ca2+-binding RTX toxin-like protein
MARHCKNIKLGTLALAFLAGQALSFEVELIDRRLIITGVDEVFTSDEIEIVEDGAELWVRVIGVEFGGFRVLKTDVDQIEVALHAGDDAFIAPGIDVPMIVSGGFGADHIITGTANDNVFGNTDDDMISTGLGDDFIVGGDGGDTIFAGPGDDIIYGFIPVGDASEIVLCYQDADTIDAGPGSDYVEGGPDNDIIHAGVEEASVWQTDIVYGFVPAGEDLVLPFPCTDDDFIEGVGGSLRVHAGPGNDIVMASEGGAYTDMIEWPEDSIWGGTGNDVLSSGDGKDEVHGGDGDDEINCGDDDDTAFGERGLDVIMGGGGMDELHGGDDADELYGETGNDTLKGGQGNDILDGGTQSDTLEGFQGDDLLFGRSGNDVLLGGEGEDVLRGHNGDDRLDGGLGADLLLGGTGSDVLISGVFSTLDGNEDDDVLFGGDDDDMLYADAGEDELYGEAGDDLLVSIDDWAGLSSMDTLDGGDGFDSFWYDSDRDGWTAGDLVVDASAAELESNMHEFERFRNDADYTWDGDAISDPNLAPGLSYLSFSDNPLFGTNGPVFTDLNQGSVGSCWLLSGLGATAIVSQNAIRQAVIPLPDGTYLFEWGRAHYRHDADLPVRNSDGAFPYAGLGHDNSIWVAIFEKMVADRRFSLGEIFTFGEYDSVAIGSPGKVFTKLDANKRSLWDRLPGSHLVTPINFANHIGGMLDDGEAVAICTTFINIPDRLYPFHCYTVLEVIRDAEGFPVEIELFNPWGIDVNQDDIDSGDKTAYGNNNDGITRVTIDEFFWAFRVVPGQVANGDFSEFDE